MPKLRHTNRYSGARGLVAAGHPATAEAGAAILRDGGNAVDAAVGAVSTAFVAEPVLTGAGGGGFMLVWHGKAPARLYDGFPCMPGGMAPAPDLRAVTVDFGDTIQTFHIGQASVAPPSLLAMLFAAHGEHGRLPLGEVLAPALDAARNGIRLNALQASFIRLLQPILTDTDACRSLHAPQGKLLGEGDEFRNADLANTLEMLAIEGIGEMYHGDLARSIVRACSPHGLLGMDDLQRAQVHRRDPLRVPAMGGELLTNPPPSSGGLLIAYAMALLERLQSDPGFSINPAMAAALAAASRLRATGFDRQVYQPGIDSDILQSQRLDSAAEGVRTSMLAGSRQLSEPANRHGSTTHISIVDGDGMAVSVTTSNGEGSGIVVPGTGIHLNNMLGEEDINPLGFHTLAPGTSLSSMMAPSVFLKAGRPALVLGSGGSNRLRGAILQVLCRHILAGEAIEEAVQAPRLHNEGSKLDVEPGLLSDAQRHQLLQLGWKIRDWRQQSVYFGGVHAISLNGHGQLHGAGDPRRGGAIAWA